MATKIKSASRTEHLLRRLQRDLTGYYVRKIEEFTQPTSAVKTQTARYNKYFATVPLRAESDTAVVRAIAQHNVVCVGDYHAFSAAQREFLDIVEAFRIDQRPPIIVLESVPSSAHAALEHYIKGHISAQELFEDIRFDKLWGFDPFSMENILAYARKHRVPIYGMNIVPPKKQTRAQNFFKIREKHFFERLRDIAKRHSKHRVFALVGELHLLPRNLPALWSAGRRRAPLLCIHQNPDPVYWRKSARRPLNCRHSFKIDVHNYVLLNSHPWIKHHSYWRILQKAVEYSDLTEDERLEEIQFAEYEQIETIISHMRPILDIKYKTPEFSIYNRLDFALPAIIKKSPYLTPRQKHCALALFKSEIGFYLPKEHVLFFPHHTTNETLDAAVRILSAADRRWTHVFGATRADFYAWMMMEAYVFGLSKIMNPARHPPRVYKLMQFPLIQKHWKTICRILHTSRANHRAWDKLADLITGPEFSAAPEAQFSLIQWLGRHWGHQWFRAHLDRPEFDIVAIGPPAGPMRVQTARRAFYHILKKATFVVNITSIEL